MSDEPDPFNLASLKINLSFKEDFDVCEEDAQRDPRPASEKTRMVQGPF